MSLDHELKKRLVYAKRLLLHGINHANKGTTLSRMIAIHDLDNAIEWLLGCIGTYYNIGGLANQNFPNLWNKVNNEVETQLGKSLPYEQHIKQHLHHLRNGVQHHGAIPDIKDLIRVRVYAEDFFKEVCLDIFQINYDELYLAIQIDDDEIRDLFMKSEEMFGKEEYKESLKFLATAFAVAERNTLRKIGRAFYSVSKMIDLPDGKRIDISDCFNDLYETIATLMLGIDYKKYCRFREVTPIVHAYGRPTLSLITGKVESPLVGYVTQKSRNPERDAVIFCLEFVLEAISEWQEIW